MSLIAVQMMDKLPRLNNGL